MDGGEKSTEEPFKMQESPISSAVWKDDSSPLKSSVKVVESLLSKPLRWKGLDEKVKEWPQLY